MATPPEAPPIAPPAWTRRLWAVRVGIIALLLGLLLGAWAGPPMALLVLAIGFLAILSGLLSKEPRRAVAWMKGASLVMLAIAVMGLLIGLRERSLRPRSARNQASAAASLHTINTAERDYAATYKAGYSPTLAALDGSAGAQPTPSAAGLIDSVLAGGVKSGYRITYMPGPPDRAGHVKTYTVIAQPLTYEWTGRNSYFTDESGVIRQTKEDRPATAKDPPVGG